MFGFTSSGQSLKSLEGSLLHADLIDALTTSAEEIRFPADREPYAHQLAAWKHLCGDKARSAVISAGTGSGKTECFLVPVLNDLAQEAAKHGRLQGVRALMLYPLNALINSQRERLGAGQSPSGQHPILPIQRTNA